MQVFLATSVKVLSVTAVLHTYKIAITIKSTEVPNPWRNNYFNCSSTVVENCKVAEHRVPHRIMPHTKIIVMPMYSCMHAKFEPACMQSLNPPLIMYCCIAIVIRRNTEANFSILSRDSDKHSR